MRASLQAAAQRRLMRHGVSVTRWPGPSPLARQVRRIVSRTEVSQVIDVGAYRGDFARMVREDVGYRGPIVSFEPNPAAFKMLAQACAHDSLWKGEQVALGATASSQSLKLYAGPDFNSLLTPTAYGAERFGEMEFTGTVEVPVKRLDSFPLADGPLLLKTDTQGYDLQVLEGASGVLNRVVVLIIEVAVKAIYEGAPVTAETLAYAAGLGFELNALLPVTTQEDRLRVVEFDAVFLRPA